MDGTGERYTFGVPGATLRVCGSTSVTPPGAARRSRSVSEAGDGAAESGLWDAGQSDREARLVGAVRMDRDLDR